MCFWEPRSHNQTNCFYLVCLTTYWGRHVWLYLTKIQHLHLFYDLEQFTGQILTLPPSLTMPGWTSHYVLLLQYPDFYHNHSRLGSALKGGSGFHLYCHQRIFQWTQWLDDLYSCPTLLEFSAGKLSQDENPNWF